MADDAPRRPRPGPALRWVIGIVAVQGIVILLAAVAFAAWAFAGHPKDRAVALGVALLGALAALVLVGTARGLARWARASVSPMLLVELLLLPIGWSMAQAGQWAISAALVIPALAVIGLLFSPEGRAVMRGPDTGTTDAD